MPKVSAEHQRRQIERICRAAIRCFASNGFHATSMDTIIAEAGMSSSTVYSYFPGGKQEIIRAVSSVRFEPLLAIRDLARAEELVDLDEAFRKIIVEGWLAPEPDDVEGKPTKHARMVVNAWSEIARDLEVSRVYRERYSILKDELTRLIQRWQDAGSIRVDLEARDIATLACDMLYGVVAEQIILDKADYSAFSHFVRLLKV